MTDGEPVCDFLWLGTGSVSKLLLSLGLVPPSRFLVTLLTNPPLPELSDTAPGPSDSVILKALNIPPPLYVRVTFFVILHTA